MRLDSGLSLKMGSWFARAVAAPASTLINGLVSYWPLDEVSGTRADSVGDNDLTDNNTVGYDTGVNGNAASFTAGNAESLSLAAALQSAPKTYALWYKSGGIAAIRRILKDKGVYLDVWHDGVNNLNVKVQVFDGTGYPEANTGFVTLAPGWIHIVVTVEDGDAVNVYVNDDAFTATAELTAEAGTEAFVLDVDDAGSGLIDEVAIWSRVLTADERTELYNAGAGVYYNGSDFV